MARDLGELTKEALGLPPDDRVVLAESLLLTLDEAHDRFVDKAIMAELEKRLRDLREGKTEGIPAEQALREVRAAIRKRS